jgi:hypothetical protein
VIVSVQEADSVLKFSWDAAIPLQGLFACCQRQGNRMDVHGWTWTTTPVAMPMFSSFL